MLCFFHVLSTLKIVLLSLHCTVVWLVSCDSFGKEILHCFFIQIHNMFCDTLHVRARCDSSCSCWYGASVGSNLCDTSALWCHDSADDCNNCWKNHVRQSWVQLPAHVDGVYWYHFQFFSCLWLCGTLVKVSVQEWVHYSTISWCQLAASYSSEIVKHVV